MALTGPLRRPHIWQSRIVAAPDGLYRGARDAREPAEWADCAMIYDDLGEPWGTVAWLHDRPNEWWLGRYPFEAEKGWPPLMGAEDVMLAAEYRCDLALLETPEAYVTAAWCGRADGPTAVVLDWGRPHAVNLWLSLVPAVRCETKRLARAVDAVFRATPAPHRLRVGLVETA